MPRIFLKVKYSKHLSWILAKLLQHLSFSKSFKIYFEIFQQYFKNKLYLKFFTIFFGSNIMGSLQLGIVVFLCDLS